LGHASESVGTAYVGVLLQRERAKEHEDAQHDSTHDPA
jgi:hypothetical protein